MASCSAPGEALTSPQTVEGAVGWVYAMVEWLGPGFSPGKAFRDYQPALELSTADARCLTNALSAATGLLGPRIRDLAYRESMAYLRRHPDCNGRPVSPPARWWLIEREESDQPSVAYEDGDGEWWEWEPATDRLYSTSWLFTDYYYNNYNTDDRELRFTSLTSAEARRRIELGIGPSNPPNLIASRRRYPVSLDPTTLFPNDDA